jgi:hypothetical protein
VPGTGGAQEGAASFKATSASASRAPAEEGLRVKG